MYAFLQFISIFLAGALIWGCAPGHPSEDRRAQLHLQLGTALLNKGNYPGALQELLIAEKLDPKNPTVHNNLGLAYFVRQKYSEAESHIKKALLLAPKYTDAQNNLGRVYIEMGKFDLAIEILQIANQDLTYPYPDKTLTNLGIALFHKGEFLKARDHLKKSLGIQRGNCISYSFYGRSLFELSEFKMAADSLDQAIALCKTAKYDEPHYFSALSYYKIGDKPRAVARLEELLTLYPESKYSSQSKSMLQMIR